MKTKKIDTKKIEKAFAEILKAIGEDITRPGLKGTPQRIGKLYKEIFSGLHNDPKEVLKSFIPIHIS